MQLGRSVRIGSRTTASLILRDELNRRTMQTETSWLNVIMMIMKIKRTQDNTVQRAWHSSEMSWICLPHPKRFALRKQGEVSQYKEMMTIDVQMHTALEASR